MTPEIRDRIEAMGSELSMEMIGGSIAMFTPMIAPVDADIAITRDHRYGPHERNRLDIFCKQGLEGAPVVVFLHGGAFVGGDKQREGSPFCDNVGAAMARAGLVGVNMTYRLAPDSKYPSGEEDVALAVAWLREHVAQFGGDPGKIVLLGTSAGAVHVAGYVAHAEHHAAEGSGLAGAAMLSGKFDPATCEVNPSHFAYYGEDAQGWAAASVVDGLRETQVPLLFTTSEFDPADFKKQAALLVADWGRAGRYPEMHYLVGHNHMSPYLSFGSDVRDLEELVVDFVRRVTG